MPSGLEESRLKSPKEIQISIEISHFVGGISAQIPPSPEVIWKIPKDTPPAQRAEAEAGKKRDTSNGVEEEARVPSGISEEIFPIPKRSRGIWSIFNGKMRIFSLEKIGL